MHGEAFKTGGGAASSSSLFPPPFDILLASGEAEKLVGTFLSGGL